MSDNTNSQAAQLLKADNDNLVDWLHDDIGQNLVAIRSFANAIIEGNHGTAGDTDELARFIKQAADLAYRATYDLMQELRAQDASNQSINPGLALCLEESRLKEKHISYELHVDSDLDNLDIFTKAVILRSTRCFVNFCKQNKQPSTLFIELRHRQPADSDHSILLRFCYRGSLDILPREASSLSALKNRIEASGGELSIDSNDLNSITMSICLTPDSGGSPTETWQR